MSHKVLYTIPARFRRLENLHILFWLIKDACWALNFRIPGIIMIFPTIIAALVITWQTRRIISELVHNLAILFWITANCTWMVGEFYGLDEGQFGFRNLALIPFSIGLSILLSFYILYYTRRSFREKVLLQTEEKVNNKMNGKAEPKTT